MKQLHVRAERVLAVIGLAMSATVVASCATALVPAPSPFTRTLDTSTNVAVPTLTTATAIPEVTSPAPPPDAVELLAQVTRVPSLPQVPGYERSCSPGKGCVFGPAWKDIERTGCDTRNRVLAAQLRDLVFKPGTKRCKVISGVLDDPYSGTVLTFGGGGSKIQIDHVFPLARAWDAGAATWSVDERIRFANDLDNLVAASGSLNSSKGDSGPENWLPPNTAFACPYALKYLRIAVKYRLAITDGDGAAVGRACG